MNFFKNLFSKKKKMFTDEDIIEAGACPNCWGKQQYDDKFLAFSNDQTKSNINKDKQHLKSFVQQYIETGITGIKLKKEGDYLTCPTCNLKHKYISSKAN